MKATNNIKTLSAGLKEIPEDSIVAAHKSYIDILLKNQNVHIYALMEKEHLLENILALRNFPDSATDYSIISLATPNFTSKNHQQMYRLMFIGFINHLSNALSIKSALRVCNLIDSVDIFKAAFYNFKISGYLRSLISLVYNPSEYYCSCCGHRIQNGLCFRDGGLLSDLYSSAWMSLHGFNECQIKCAFMREYTRSIISKELSLILYPELYFNACFKGLCNAAYWKTSKMPLVLTKEESLREIFKNMFMLQLSKEKLHPVKELARQATHDSLFIKVSNLCIIDAARGDYHYEILKNRMNAIIDNMADHWQDVPYCIDKVKELAEILEIIRQYDKYYHAKISKKTEGITSLPSRLDIRIMEQCYKFERIYNEVSKFLQLIERFKDIVKIEVFAENISRNNILSEYLIDFKILQDERLIKAILKDVSSEMIVI